MRKENRGSTRKGDFANTWKRKKSWKPCNYLLWGSILGKAIMSFLFMIFILFHSYFHLLFWALLCWLVDIKDHSFALSSRTLYMYAQFWFILDFFFSSLFPTLFLGDGEMTSSMTKLLGLEEWGYGESELNGILCACCANHVLIWTVDYLINNWIKNTNWDCKQLQPSSSICNEVIKKENSRPKHGLWPYFQSSRHSQEPSYGHHHQ